MKKIIKECPDDTSPVVMDECVNDEVDHDNKRNLIEVKETNINDEDEDDTEVNDEEKNVTTDTESSTSEEIDDKHKGEKEVIAGKT